MIVSGFGRRAVSSPRPADRSYPETDWQHQKDVLSPATVRTAVDGDRPLRYRSGLHLISTALLLAVLAACAHAPAPLPPAPVPVVTPVDPPAASIEEARALYAAGKLERYQRSLEALSLSSDPVVARRATALLGLFDVEQKNWNAAFDSLSKAVTLDPAVAPFLQLRLIDVEENRSNFRNAAAIASQIVATAPDSSAAVIARLRLPALYAQLGDAAGTDSAFAQSMAVPIDDLTEERFVELATALDKAGRPELATQVRMHLLLDYPQGRFTEKTYGQLATMPDSPIDTLPFAQSLALAQHLVRDDRYDQAFDLLDRISKRFPAEANADEYRNLRDRALFGSRKYTELLNETAGARLEPGLMLLRARAAWRKGDNEAFLRGLSDIEHEFPSSPQSVEAKLLRAKYYVTDETDYEKSIANLRAAIDAGDAGSDGENLWTLGWTYTLAGHYPEALATFDDYLKRFPDGSYADNALFWSGKILEKTGRVSERDAKFRELIEKLPFSYFSYRAKEILGGGAVTTTPENTIGVNGANAVPSSPPGEGRPIGETAATTPPDPEAAQIIATPPASQEVFPDVQAQIASVTDPRVESVRELDAIYLNRDASLEMKRLAAAYPENLGLQFMLADVYVRGGEPFAANNVLQRRFRDFVRHGGVGIPHRFWEILYPLNYWPVISAEAQKRGVDPYLVASIIRQESGFDPTVVSNAGAVGLMQIMPAEAQSIGTKAGIADVTRASLFDPMINIEVGVAEYSQKLAELRSNPILAIAAYNAGEDAVGKWLAHTPIDDIDLFVESIPYAETRLYVKTVMRNRFEYRRIYESSNAGAPSP